MDEARTQVARTLRVLREARSLTLSDLARRSGVAKATLSALEAGAANPTLDTLWALARALHVSLGDLLSPGAPALTVVRAAEGVPIKGQAVVGRLFHRCDVPAARLEMFEAEVGRRRQQSPPHPPGVVEHIFLIEGRLRVGPVDGPLELHAGDYLRMESSWPHVYEGLERGTRMFLVMEYPRPGSGLAPERDAHPRRLKKARRASG